MSFEIPSEWFEKAEGTNSVPDNFLKGEPYSVAISRGGPAKGTAYHEYYLP